ncbi:MAG: tetratricopeptide repeat protein [Armatimonadota bacterium]
MTDGTPTEREHATELLKQRDFERSIPSLLKAIADEPQDVDLYLYLAYAHAQNGDIDKAIKILEDTVDIAPANAKVHYNLGVAYQKARNTTQAKDEYLRALGLDAAYTAPKQALDSLDTASV